MTFQTYKRISNDIKNIKVSKKKKALIYITSLIISAILVLIPVFTLINLLIFRDYVKLIVIGFGFLLYFMLFIAEALYFEARTARLVKGTYIIAFMHSLVYLLVIIIVLIIILNMGVF